jgi:DNA-binding NarL/FixJ family response regulator
MKHGSSSSGIPGNVESSHSQRLTASTLVHVPSTEIQRPLDDQLAPGWTALERGDWAAARRVFEAALEAGEAPEALEGLGRATVWLDDPDTVFSVSERAYSLYRKRGDRLGAARAALQLGLAAQYLRGQAAVASGWLERSARLLEGVEPAAEHGWLGVWRAHFALLGDHDLEGAASLAAETGAVARKLGLAEVEMLALAQEGLVLVSKGEVAEGMRRLDEATAAATSGELADWLAISNVCCYLIYACKRVRDYGRAAEWCDRVKEMSVRHGDRITFASCRTHYADLLILRGSWAEADEEIAANVTELGPFGRARAADGVVRLAELRRRQGRLDEAAALGRKVESHPRAPLVRGALALDLDDTAEAADLADRFLRRIPEAERTERAEGLELLVAGAAAGGETARAREALAELTEIAGAVGTAPLRAAAALAVGRVAAAAGDHDLARRSFEDALDLYGQSGAPFEAARARLSLARALHALDRGEPALREARAALDALVTLGAEHEVSRAAELVRELGGPASATPDPAGLTAREREVLHLVAQGRSNQEIAAQLVLSVRTVERHVANIYDKLGAAGKVARASAAAYALRHGI